MSYSSFFPMISDKNALVIRYKSARTKSQFKEMEKVNSTLGLARTKSEQLMESVAAAMAAMRSSPSGESPATASSAAEGGSGNVSRRSSRRTISAASPGRGGTGRSGMTHIRKSRSAQLSQLIDDQVNNGAALSRASSASLGLSFSLTGYIMPPEDMADSKPYSDDDDVPEDLEAGTVRKRIETEPTLPIYLKFTDVTYKVVLKGLASTQEKQILQGITGAVNPGEVLALMGPSGSGKTTLLNLLGGRLAQPAPGSCITYNDQPYSKTLKSRIGFVTQDDVLFPHLTVKETLKYSAYLRLPKTLTKEQKEKRALDVIYELGLERCQDTMIGGSFVRGVSGGERKRVCIGNEIIINPSLLFLDEPTSGKGSLLYFGKASEATVYFSSVGCSPLIAMNPAEFLLDLANGNLNDITVPPELEDKVQMGNSQIETSNGKPSPAVINDYLVEAYDSRVAEKEKRKLKLPIPIDEEMKTKLSSPKREWGASWCEQYTILFKRGIKERRHDYFSWLRITQVLVTAIILGLLWWQSNTRTIVALQDQAGLLFFISVFWGFFPVFTAIFTFPQERAMLKKERSADMYRLSAYFVARTTSDLPLDLILPLLFLLIVYFMAGLKLKAETFFLTMLTVFLCIVAAQGLGLAIGASLMDLKRATTLASVAVMAFMLAGGYFVKSVPVFICWLRYLSFNYHTYKLLLKIQYEDITPAINGVKFDSGMTEVGALVGMVFGYRLLAYMFLRGMKLHA
ncbi:hypothetical protein V2J09_018616 [Rumex salicifolius]